jgi:hypothetical protein
MGLGFRPNPLPLGRIGLDLSADPSDCHIQLSLDFCAQGALVLLQDVLLIPEAELSQHFLVRAEAGLAGCFEHLQTQEDQQVRILDVPQVQ